MAKKNIIPFEEAIKLLKEGKVIAEVGNDGTQNVQGSQAEPQVQNWLKVVNNGIENVITVVYRNGHLQPWQPLSKTILNGQFYEYVPVL